eukprot:1142912-Pelagomonas_calceolata.AAC.2
MRSAGVQGVSAKAYTLAYVGKAGDNGCTDNVKCLTWGSIGRVKFIKLISEVTGHALNLNIRPCMLFILRGRL